VYSDGDLSAQDNANGPVPSARKGYARRAGADFAHLPALRTLDAAVGADFALARTRDGST